MTQTEILKSGLAALRSKGWGQDCYGFGIGVPSCVVGGLAVGVLRPFSATLFGERMTCAQMSWSKGFLTAACDSGVYQLLQQLTGDASVEHWNDTEGRTFADVEALLTAAIAISEEQAAEVEAAETVTVTA